MTVINETVIFKYFHWFRHACAVSFLPVLQASFFRTSGSGMDFFKVHQYSLYHRTYGRQSEPRELESRISVKNKSSSLHKHQPNKQSFKQWTCACASLPSFQNLSAPTCEDLYETLMMIPPTTHKRVIRPKQISSISKASSSMLQHSITVTDRWKYNNVNCNKYNIQYRYIGRNPDTQMHTSLSMAVWKRENGYWVGEYTLLGADGDPKVGDLPTKPWPYPYDHYTGFIHIDIKGNTLTQNNVFLYPPQVS